MASGETSSGGPETPPPGALACGALVVARLAIAGWVGAAALFVMTSIAEQRRPFADPVKNELAVIRFPWYYRFGFTLTGATLVAGHFARRHPALAGARRWALFGLLAAAMAVMAADYRWVYRPLVEMVTPPERPRSAEFERYHEMSKWVNLAHGGLCLAAGALVCASGTRGN